ncbi:MAG: hypothetical protein HY721_28490, partial [Planctomycetes bacterium]|nr:hypothetical protein [Planctomycetota bacterium]
ARSCPRLRPEAYDGRRLGEQLDEECRSWIQVETTKDGRRKNHLDRAANVFRVSRIFDWYSEDFGEGEEGVLAFLKKHASPSDREHLEKVKVRIEYLPYDWSSNRQ